MSTTPIPSNILCVNCGYDLSGQPESNVCPECATPCKQSAHQRSFLRNQSNPIEQIEIGLTGSLWVYALLSAALLLALTGAFFTAANGSIYTALNITAALAVLAGALILPPAQLAVATPLHPKNATPKQNTPARVYCAGLLGLLVSVVAQFAVAIEPMQLLSHTTAIILALSIYMTFRGLTGQARGIALALGIPELNRFIRPIARLVVVPLSAAVLIVHTGHTVARLRYSFFPLGLNAGTWQDVLIITLAACLLLHLVITIVFWHHLRTRLKQLAEPDSPAPATPPAP